MTREDAGEFGIGFNVYGLSMGTKSTSTTPLASKGSLMHSSEK